MTYNQVVRVATSNNFNCTTKEWKQLNEFSKSNPDKFFFINSNINTPKLSTIANHNSKAVITANPNLIISQKGIDSVISKLQTIKDKVAFVRIKYLPNYPLIKKLITSVLNEGIPIVITLQRFNGKESLLKYTNLAFYKFSCSRYRLSNQELNRITDFVTASRNIGFPIYICDQTGKGCQTCGLCAKLTINQELPITSLNLSTSGICPYNCPDCYAKTMQHFVISMGHNPIAYNVIHQNDKQAGKTKHIKNNSK